MFKFRIEMSESKESLEKNFEKHRESLENLREWILTQPHIPNNFPTATLYRYFKVCKYDLKNSKQLLDHNVKFRIKHQYLFADREIDSEEFQKVANTVQFISLPKKTEDGFTLEVYRIADANLEYFILKDLYKLVFMVHDLLALNVPNTNGLIAIFDAKDFSFWHFMKLVQHVATVVHFLQYVQEADCIDIRKIHFVNCSPIVSKVHAFIKPFLARETASIMYFHPTFESLHEHVDKEYLPIDFGGCEGTLDEHMKNTLNNLRKHRDYLTKNDNFFLTHQ